MSYVTHLRNTIEVTLYNLPSFSFFLLFFLLPPIYNQTKRSTKGKIGMERQGIITHLNRNIMSSKRSERCNFGNDEPSAMFETLISPFARLFFSSFFVLFFFFFLNETNLVFRMEDKFFIGKLHNGPSVYTIMNWPLNFQKM